MLVNIDHEQENGHIMLVEVAMGHVQFFESNRDLVRYLLELDGDEEQNLFIYDFIFKRRVMVKQIIQIDFEE